MLSSLFINPGSVNRGSFIGQWNPTLLPLSTNAGSCSQVSNCQPHGQNRCIIFQWKRKPALRAESGDLSCLYSEAFAVRVCVCKCARAGVSAQACKYLQTQGVVNMHLTPDECDLLIFSLVWTCHRRLIPRFFKSFETVKQKRALFPVVDQYIASTAGCVWQTNYQRPLLGYACSWLSSKPDISKPWLYIFFYST